MIRIRDPYKGRTARNTGDVNQDEACGQVQEKGQVKKMTEQEPDGDQGRDLSLSHSWA